MRNGIGMILDLLKYKENVAKIGNFKGYFVSDRN